MALFQPPQTSLPIQTFEDLLPALTSVLKAVYNAGESDEPRLKLAIAAATEDLKEKLARAKQLVEEMPGGEMLLEDQDSAIDALERFRDQRRAHISIFGALAPSGSVNVVASKEEQAKSEDVEMETR